MKASEGDYQSQIRLEAIHKLIDPCLHFYESDVRRILKKGYSPQVERGLQLYRLMSRLRLFCEPVGDTVGVACRVKLINLEEATFSRLLDIKAAHGLVWRAADKRESTETFNYLELLTPEEKTLYQRSKKYFGGRKRPTLKSLATGLLSEESEIFSDRSVSNYLAAVRDFKRQYKDVLGITWYFIGAIDSYNRDAKTGRELSSMVVVNLKKVARATDFQKILDGFDRSVWGTQSIPKSFLEGFSASAEIMNGFDANYRRSAEGFRSAISQGFQHQDALANHFRSQLEGSGTLAESMKGLVASSRFGIESAVRAIFAGFPNQVGFAKYLTAPTFGQGFK